MHAEIRKWLSLIISFTQSIALTSQMFMKLIRMTVQKSYMLAIFALLLVGANSGYWPHPRLSFFPNVDLKDGSCNSVVSESSNVVPFLAFYFCSMLHLNNEKIFPIHKKWQNIFCIVYIQTEDVTLSLPKATRCIKFINKGAPWLHKARLVFRYYQHFRRTLLWRK